MRQLNQIARVRSTHFRYTPAILGVTMPDPPRRMTRRQAASPRCPTARVRCVRAQKEVTIGRC